MGRNHTNDSWDRNKVTFCDTCRVTQLHNKNNYITKIIRGLQRTCIRPSLTLKACAVTLPFACAQSNLGIRHKHRKSEILAKSRLIKCCYFYKQLFELSLRDNQQENVHFHTLLAHQKRLFFTKLVFITTLLNNTLIFQVKCLFSIFFIC